MKKRTISLVLVALLLVQVFCVSAFAAEPKGGFSVLLDKEKREVIIMGSGFEPNEMISVIGLYNSMDASDLSKADYINQINADAEGNINFTYPSKAEWAVGAYIFVLLNGAPGMADILVNGVPSVTITDYTNTLSAGYKANVKVVLETENVPDGSIVEVAFMDEKVVPVNGVAWFMNIQVTAIAGDYPITATISGTTAKDEVEVEVIADPVKLWNPDINVAGESFSVVFADTVSCVKAKNAFDGYVKVADTTIMEGTSIDGNVVYIDSAIKDGDIVVLSGVKFAKYFPSYSFTFTLKSGNVEKPQLEAIYYVKEESYTQTKANSIVMIFDEQVKPKVGNDWGVLFNDNCLAIDGKLYLNGGEGGYEWTYSTDTALAEDGTFAVYITFTKGVIIRKDVTVFSTPTPTNAIIDLDGNEADAINEKVEVLLNLP